MNTPGRVTADLNHSLDGMDAQDDRAQEWLEERRRYLLQDRPGLSLVTEALYLDENGYPLDEALFALYEAWQRGAHVMEAAANVVLLIQEKAERMAGYWAELKRLQDTPSALTPDEEDLPF